jgi:hypothetical protein
MTLKGEPRSWWLTTALNLETGAEVHKLVVRDFFFL